VIPVRIGLAVLGCLVMAAVQAPDRLRPDPPRVCDSCAEWNAPVAPFQIFGNTYYVGPAGVSSILVTSPTGHVLLDGALPQSAVEIDANIRTLGFKPEDIRLIVISHAHFDHVGGIAALARLSGAPVAASPEAAKALARGNVMPDDPQASLGEAAMAFPPVPHVRVIRDGEALQAGGVTVTAHFTPGHTPGGVTWSWRSCEGARCLDVVYIDSLNAVSGPNFRFTGDATHPSLVPVFRHSLATVEALPCDVVLTDHPSAANLDAKRAARASSPETNPFVDPAGCRAVVRAARELLESRIASEGRGRR
jgi:metallo-beta-lactamase class B